MYSAWRWNGAEMRPNKQSQAPRIVDISGPQRIAQRQKNRDHIHRYSTEKWSRDSNVESLLLNFAHLLARTAVFVWSRRSHGTSWSSTRRPSAAGAFDQPKSKIDSLPSHHVRSLRDHEPLKVHPRRCLCGGVRRGDADVGGGEQAGR